MTIDYNRFGEGNYSHGSTFAGGHHGGGNQNHRQGNGEEQNEFAEFNTAGEGTKMHPHRLYQPPVPPVDHHYGRDRPGCMYQPNVVETMSDSSLMNDHAFLSVATSILASMENNEVMMKAKSHERSESAANVLKKMLTQDELKMFSDALGSRLNLMPQYPSWGESHVCTIVRRCEGIFGKELRALLQATSNTFHNYRQHSERRDDLSGPSLDKKSSRTHPEAIPITNVNMENASANPNHREADVDLTQHVIWEKETTRVEPKGPVLESSKVKGVRAFETMSAVSSHFNESEVYDMVVEAKLDEMKTEEKKKVYCKSPVAAVSNSSGTKKDELDDDKSVASMYSLSRQRSSKSPQTKNRKIVSVRAPETLPGKFMFEARMDDHVFMVCVPEGGVEKGQIFQSPALNLDSKSVFDPTGRIKRLTDMHTPDNQWRSGLFSIFAHGAFHPMAINSILCTYVSLAQVMTRLQLDSSGNKTSSLRSRVNFNLVRLFPFVLATLHGILFFLLYRAFHLHLKSQLWVFIYSCIPVLIADICIFGYFIYMTGKVRRLVREEYNIEEYGCFGLRDEVLSFFCAPLVVSQLGRHTADYDTYVGAYCTKTGLSNHIEVKLPSDENEYHSMGIQV